MAERLARELAHPGPDADPGSWSEYVSAAAVLVPYSSAAEAQWAVDRAPTMVHMGGPHSWGAIRGRGGSVLYVHGPDDPLYGEWSLVCPIDPWQGWVLVCAEDFDGQCLLISDEDETARDDLRGLHYRLASALSMELPPSDPPHSPLRGKNEAG